MKSIKLKITNDRGIKRLVKNVPIYLQTSLGQQKKEFIPYVSNKVGIYVCGITPYDYAHIGHGRCYVFFDCLVRFFRFMHYHVTYVRNVTDIDDKLLQRAEQKHGSMFEYASVSQTFFEFFHDDMKRLGCLSPDKEPRATKHIDTMIIFINQLIEKGYAYTTDDGSVYFSITRFDTYGVLSARKIEQLQPGARVKVDLHKKHPGDFVLWKGNKNKHFWLSPWGYGRPAWHIECSAMAKEFLGTTIDIHGGGSDLLFPHHENERAQSEALHGDLFARYWLHNAFVLLDKKKMSKSLGNVISLRDMFAKYDPMVIRFYFLQHHYRTPIEFSFDLLTATQVAYKKLISAVSLVSHASFSLKECLSHDVLAKIISALADDMNTPKALGIFFEHIDLFRTDRAFAQKAKVILQSVFGLSLEPLADQQLITQEIQDLIEQRNKARRQSDWARADKIRDQLKKLGYQVHDTKV